MKPVLFIKNLSIKNKLTSIILLVVIVAMFFVMAFSLIEKMNNAKTNLVNNTILNGNIVGEYCLTALYFQRADAADDALMKLESVPYILNAKVYDADKVIFSEYNREKFNEDFLKKYSGKDKNSYFEEDYLVVSVPLIYNGEKLGILFLRSSLESLNKEINEFILFIFILFIIIMILSYFIALKLQKVVSDPIQHLAEVTKEITKSKNFNVRVQKQAKDEIGSLYDEFNFMLERIQISSVERDEALHTLGISEERLNLALEGSNDGLWDWDLSTNNVYFSPRYEIMLEYNPGELSGRIETWIDLVVKEDIDDVLKLVNDHLKGISSQYKSEFRIKTKNGNIKWILDRGKVVKWDETGNPLRMVGTHTDITEMKKSEEELLNAKNKAEKSDKFKSEFLAQMSHEIRSPINVILNFTSLLKDELKNKIEDDLAQSFDYIDSGGRRIIRTIDMILNMSEIQTGIVELNPQPHNITEEILNGLVKEYKTQARIKGLELTLNSFHVDNHKIWIDEYSVSQIFSNLIDNAIKYTHSGKIEITVYSNSSGVTVDVIDTGIGISKEYLPNLFDAFTQEEGGYGRKFEGNGLGLALVKKYCELNNAEIFVDSTKGKGTKFTVKFNSN
ncbi:MAG: PAS domain-containing protein [Bacteroidetes bacterium]|nr:PAS domain-containing protein [Bacteroidota bacterium]